MSVRRPNAAVCLALWIASIAPSCSKSELAEDAPFSGAPIILVSLDTVRWDAVSGFGGEDGATPALEALGADGIRCVNAISSSHHTAPSHASLLTGFSPFVHGVGMAADGKIFAIPTALPTLAETLAGAGYATAAFTDGVQLVPERNFDRGFDVFDDEYSGLPDKLDAMRAFLEANRDEPFFLFAHTYRAHQPYRVPEDLLEGVIGDYRGTFRMAAVAMAEMDHADYIGTEPEQVAAKREWMAQLSPHRSRGLDDLHFLRRVYDAGVVGADRELEALLGLLRELELYDEVILVVTSDHGESFREHGSAGHTDLFDEIVRVPLVVRLPGGRSAGREVDATVSAVQVAPTLLELVGARSPIALEGRSIAASLAGDDVVAEDVAFAAMYVNEQAEPLFTATRSRSYKRLDAHAPAAEIHDFWSALAPATLFDLEADPAEKTKLGPEHPEFDAFGRARASAEKRWADMRRRHGLEEATTGALSPELEGRMQDLGYMGEDDP